MKKAMPLLLGLMLCCSCSRFTEPRVAHWHDEVIGKLGPPLGEMVNIEGVVGEELPAPGAPAKFKFPVLRVEKVNGDALRSPVTLPFEWSFPGSGKEPGPGVKFHCRGYETGRYFGRPKEAYDLLGSESPMAPHHFVCRFVVCKRIEKQQNKPDAGDGK